MPIPHRRFVGRRQVMIEQSLDTEHSVLTVRVRDSLERGDFAALAGAVDPYIELTGGLGGLVIEVPAFPGWEDFGAMVAHFRFVRDHHKRIGKVALVTDSALGSVAEQLASHFVSAQIRHFPAGGLESAMDWVKDRA
jgi:hypothetical protein